VSFSPAELVIFDCDGVLVDSEPLANQVLSDAIAELGLPAGLGLVTERFKGRSLADCVRLIEEDLGRPVPEDFLTRLNARTYAAFRQQLQAIPGVADLVARLELPSCVASSGSHEKMRLTLGLTGLLPHFEGRLFSATEVARGKPAPDLFLHAARSLGAPPTACLVVEDSVPGVQAAVAAGMRVYGFAREEAPEVLARAGAIPFGAMTELAELLGRGL
jgi:HAD superfamily hydrolase (TIGR01509 family)